MLVEKGVKGGEVVRGNDSGERGLRHRDEVGGYGTGEGLRRQGGRGWNTRRHSRAADTHSRKYKKEQPTREQTARRSVSPELGRHHAVAPLEQKLQPHKNANAAGVDVGKDKGKQNDKRERVFDLGPAFTKEEEDEGGKDKRKSTGNRSGGARGH